MVSRKEAITVKLNQVTEDVLKVIDSYGFKQEGAYNLRLNGMAVCPRIRSLSADRRSHRRSA